MVCRPTSSFRGWNALGLVNQDLRFRLGAWQPLIIFFRASGFQSTSLFGVSGLPAIVTVCHPAFKACHATSRFVWVWGLFA